jgi:hypothetical protein
MGQLVANTNSYAQQQLLRPKKERQRSWQPVTTQELYLWLAIQIHMGLIGVPPERYWMKDGVYLPKDGLPPAAYLGKTRFQEICHFFHVSPYNSPTETPEGLPCWLLSIASKSIEIFQQIKSTLTGKNDLTRRVTHREAVFGTVIHSIFDAWHYEVLWTYALTRLP